jgi:hypothetical protein
VRGAMHRPHSKSGIASSESQVPSSFSPKKPDETFEKIGWPTR